MAWLDGRWISVKERADIIAEYQEIVDEVNDKITAGEYIEKDVLAEIDAIMDEKDRLERIHRCDGNLLEFSIEYFSEARNAENDGNWDGFDITEVNEAPDFHREIADIMNDVSLINTNAKIAVAAPRGHAKSTYLSKAFPLHELLYRKRKYVLMVSETPKVALANLDWIRNQLKFNAKLRNDFGPLLSPRDQGNLRDNNEGFIAYETQGEVKRQIALLESASTGGAIRGRNWNGYRPDLIILDDLEDARAGGNASTVDQRSQLRDWFAQSVIPLGDPKGKRTAFVYMGTTVHADALLMNVLYKRSDFKTRLYRAIITQPERMDLWEQCRLIYVDRDNPDRADAALKFYEDNEAELLKGSTVLWPEGQPLWKLMTWKWDNGSKAFNTEYMNNPIDEESQVFNPERFTYYDGVINPLEERYNVALAVDLAMGKSRTKGDYSATATVAQDKESGIIYVADSYGDRIKPDQFIEITCDKVVAHQPHVTGIESVAAQEFFADEMKKALVKRGYPAENRVKKIYNRTRKELRIEALLPRIENGTIRFSHRHTLLLEQFEQYGTGAHDDLIDALEMAVSCLAESQVTVSTVRRNDRWATGTRNYNERSRR